MISLVAYQSSEESESDTEETASSSTLPGKHSENDSSQFKNSKPSLGSAVPSKTRESVKITVPSLKEFEDDEKDEPSSKKIKKSSGSSLISMLPPPKFSKSAGSQKSFVPYVLTKKPTSSSIPVASSIRSPDSLVSSKKPTPFSKPLVRTEYHFKKELPEKDDHSSETDFFSLEKPPDDKLESNFSVSLSNKPLKSEEESSQMTGDVLQVNDLSGASSILHKNSSSSSWESQSENNTSVQFSESTSHNESYAAEPSWENQSLSSSYAGYPEISCSGKEYTADEGFLKLQGKRKGQEEINIIDVSVDDQLPDKTQWLTKSITEEKVLRPSRKKNDMPTQLQKRKHQITYLAFQAKERELELKNQWSQNKLTKRETQAKYGF